MAKFIKKSDHLEEAYKEKSGAGAIGIIWAVLALLGSVAFFANSNVIGGAVCGVLFLICLIIALFGSINSKDKDIIAAGIQGESATTRVLERLPDNYTVIQDVFVTYDGKTSEIDNIVVGKSGVFVIESKNHNGRIVGDFEDKNWVQHKVGRGGTPYSEEFYSPAKQVGTHVYRVAKYLRSNGVHAYINKVVYFSNPAAVLSLYGDSGDTAVFACRTNGGLDMLEFIKSGDENLPPAEINKIISLLTK